jgi:hypothetical protein
MFLIVALLYLVKKVSQFKINYQTFLAFQLLCLNVPNDAFLPKCNINFLYISFFFMYKKKIFHLPTICFLSQSFVKVNLLFRVDDSCLKIKLNNKTMFAFSEFISRNIHSYHPFYGGIWDFERKSRKSNINVSFNKRFYVWFDIPTKQCTIFLCIRKTYNTSSYLTICTFSRQQRQNKMLARESRAWLFAADNRIILL